MSTPPQDSRDAGRSPGANQPRVRARDHLLLRAALREEEHAVVHHGVQHDRRDQRERHDGAGERDRDDGDGG